MLAGLVCAAISAVAQPKAPELTLNGAGRFEFAAIPELALVRGIAQVVQFGFYQVDPANPWPAGALTAGPWRSSRPTRLVDTATGSPVLDVQFTYAPLTAELTYPGTWSGDVTVRIETTDGAVKSEPFRIRVLTPTSVYGDNAAAVNVSKQWNARVCPTTQSFSACRQRFTGGLSDVAPTVVFITPGTYGGQDWFITNRRYVYVLGDPVNRPTLRSDAISGSSKAMFYIANLTLQDTNLTNAGALAGSPNIMVVRSVYQCCETGQQNGIVNPNTSTGPDRWAVYWHASESKGMGGTGNTRHSAYVEGRGNSLFDVNAIRVLGARGSSAVKTVMSELNVRHSFFSVSETPGEIPATPCLPKAVSTGCLLQLPIDVPGYSSAVVFGNRFELWRGPTVGAPVGRTGVLQAAIFIRQRRETLGSDVPNYPNKSWDPPESYQGTKISPCYDWPGTASTYVDDKFWQQVRSKPLDDPGNPCTFKHFVSYNTFAQLPGSLTVSTLRDDGTFAGRVTTQFSPTIDILRMHPLLVERSINFLYGNTFEPGATKLYRLNVPPNVRNVDPQAAPFWPRNIPDEWPRAIDVEGELPSWFKL